MYIHDCLSNGRTCWLDQYYNSLCHRHQIILKIPLPGTHLPAEITQVGFPDIKYLGNILQSIYLPFQILGFYAVTGGTHIRPTNCCYSTSVREPLVFHIERLYCLVCFNVYMCVRACTRARVTFVDIFDAIVEHIEKRLCRVQNSTPITLQSRQGATNHYIFEWRIFATNTSSSPNCLGSTPGRFFYRNYTGQSQI